MDYLGTFIIYVKTLTGKTIPLQVHPSATVLSVKQTLREVENLDSISLDDMRLVARGRVL